jgi:hypothetical protein
VDVYGKGKNCHYVQHEIVWGSGGIAPFILNLGSYRGERLASRRCRFISWLNVPCSRGRGCRLCPRTNLHIFDRRQISFPRLGSEPRFSLSSPYFSHYIDYVYFGSWGFLWTKIEGAQQFLIVSLPLELLIPSECWGLSIRNIGGGQTDRQLGRERKIVTCEALWNVQWRLTVRSSNTTNNAGLCVGTFRQVALWFADLCIENIFCEGKASVLDTNFQISIQWSSKFSVRPSGKTKTGNFILATEVCGSCLKSPITFRSLEQSIHYRIHNRIPRDLSLSQIHAVHIFTYPDAGGRTIYGVGLRPFAFWSYGL